MEPNDPLSSLVGAGYRQDKHFKGGFADVYDEIEEDHQDDINFFQQLVGSSPSRILDIGAGTGRISFPLAASGHTVYAMENSDDMLDQLRAKLGPEQNSIIPLNASMTDFKVDAQFDWAIMSYNVFYYLYTLEDRNTCLDLIYKHLVPGGQIVIDINLMFPYMFQGGGNTCGLRVLNRADGTKTLYLSRPSYDPQTQINEPTYLFVHLKPDGTYDCNYVSAKHYVPNIGEMRDLLVSHQFKIEEFYGDYQRTPLRESKSKTRLVAVAKK